MLKTIEKLCSHPRTPGSDHLSTVTENLAKNLDKWGFRVTRRETSVPNWRLISGPKLILHNEQGTVVHALQPAIYSRGTPPDGVTGELHPGDNVEMLRTFCWDSFAISKGGVVVGRVIGTPYGAMRQPLPGNSCQWPTAIASTETFEAIKKTFNENNSPLKATLVIDAITEGRVPITSIIGIWPKVETRAVMTIAHIDSMYDSPGAHDNASGVAVALSLAHACVQSSTPAHFAFFCGEESNLAGSSAFVSQAGDDELSRISLALEIDSVGLGDTVALLCSKKIRKELRCLVADLSEPDSYGVQVSPQSKIAYSDVWPFMQAGLPVIRMLTRDSVGKIDQAIMHSADDTLDKINPVTLDYAFRIAQRIVASRLWK